MSVSISSYVCLSFNQVEVALRIYCHSLFHIPLNNLYSIHNCLLCPNPGNVSPLVTKHDKNLVYEAANTYIIIHTVYKMYKCV